MSDAFHSGDVPTGQVPLDDQERIAVDVPCLVCGYNLRTLQRGSRCPECGATVATSAQGGLLRFCDPGWVGTLAGGMNLIMVYTVLAMCCVPFVAATRLQSNASAESSIAVLVSFISMVVIGLFGLIGVWSVTAPEPKVAETTEALSANTVARVAMVACCVFDICGHLLSSQDEIAGVFCFAAGAVWLAAFVAFIVVVRRLTRRIPNPELARGGTIFMWGFGVCVGLVMTTAPLVMMFEKLWSSERSTVGDVLMTIATGASCGGIVFGLYGVLLVFRYRRAFARAAEDARATRAAGS